MSKTILQLSGAAALSATDNFIVAQGDATLKFGALSLLVTFLNAQAMNFSQAITVSSTTDATSSSAAALMVTGGLAVGKKTFFGAKATLTASVVGGASLNIPSGVAPTSPADGDMWYDGTNVKFRVGGTTKTFTLT